MARRDFKSINLPNDLADWIDDLLRARRIPTLSDESDSFTLPTALGAQSRDEYVRTAVAIVILATTRRGESAPVSVVQDLVKRLEKAERVSNTRSKALIRAAARKRQRPA